MKVKRKSLPDLPVQPGPRRVTRFARHPKAVDFLYLDQETVLAAGLLDMSSAMEVVRKAQASYVLGKVIEPYKVVLRCEDTVESEQRGRLNALFAWIRKEEMHAVESFIAE